MIPTLYMDFAGAIKQAAFYLEHKSNLVHSERWQGIDISKKPEMATYEVLHSSFRVPLHGDEKLQTWRDAIAPNLPWADDHFEERVCGAPINPGKEWANWPYSGSAATFLDEKGQFNHNYMERYWPKQAGRPKESTLDAVDWNNKFAEEQGIGPDTIMPNGGIRHQFYGDLNDVVQLLANDPYTRQAYLPIWFPEDTGGGSKRAPCTIGYHFIMRDGRLDVHYHIRSCDFVRHFRDDIYLTIRLLLWVLDRCREVSPLWADVIPGTYSMNIGSLHIFRNDYPMLFGHPR